MDLSHQSAVVVCQIPRIVVLGFSHPRIAVLGFHCTIQGSRGALKLLSQTKVLVHDGPIQRHLLQGKQAQDASLRFPPGVGPDGLREIHAVTL